MASGSVACQSVFLFVCLCGCLSACRPDDECTVAAMLDLAGAHSLTQSLTSQIPRLLCLAAESH